MAKRTGLGRGIGALIPMHDDAKPSRPVDVFFPYAAAATATAEQETSEELFAVPGARLAHLSPDDIVPNAQQPRTAFDEAGLAELVHSIREVGVLQPIVVRPLSEEPGKYELVMGERRLRAAKVAGLSTIPAVIRETADVDMLRDALLENLHRAQLNPLEEASAYQQLLSDFGITQDELAARIGRSRPQITNTLRLLKLPESVQLRVAAGILTAGHARAILSVGEHRGMLRLADKIVSEDLSVRAAEAAATSRPRLSVVQPLAGKRQGHLDEIAQRLGDRLDTRVRINLGARKGQIKIDFATIGDLNRILGELSQPGFGTN